MCFPDGGATAAATTGAASGTATATASASAFYTTLAIAAANAAMQYRAASQSVSAANDAAEANKKSAVESANSQYLNVIAGQIQEEDAASQEIARIEDDSIRAESSAILAGLEAGAGGGALLERPRDFRASALRYSSAVSRSAENRRGAAANNLAAISVGADGRVSNFRPEYTKPSLVSAGLTLLGGYLDATKYLAPGVPSTPANPLANGVQIPGRNYSLPIFD